MTSSELNPQQLEAMRSVSGPLMILAGAGTGKTKVIICRIANIISHGIPARKIAAMTFTNKAATEMKTRIKKMVPGPQANKVFIGTFHRFCLNILRKWPEKIERPADFSLITQADQLTLVKQSLEEHKLNGVLNPDFLLYDISTCKNALITPSLLSNPEHAKKVKTQDIEMFQLIYSTYEKLLQLNRAFDFDDCILKCYFLIKNHPEVKEKIREQYSHFLVDEFQDTNLSQYSLLTELIGPKGNICVVGDDDQSIYSWRGAVYETFMNFEEFFSPCKTVKLEQNYRCTNVVLNAANALIKKNRVRKDKSLWSKSPHHNEIIVKELRTPTDEGLWLANKCLAFLGQNYKLKDMAILYRTNSQAKIIEMALRECKLHYKTFGGQSFFTKKETKDFLAYLELISNHNSHMPFWRIINTPPRGVGLKTKEYIFHEAEKSSLSPFSHLKKSLVGFSTKVQENLSLFVKNIEEFSVAPPTNYEELERYFKDIIARFGLISHLARTVKDKDALEKKTETYQSLPGLFAAVATQAFEGKEFTLKEFLDLVTLDNRADESKEEETNHISLMTIHAAKGLEFPIVFVAGCEDGILPHKNSIDSDKQIEEERRLLYVAMTRAKEHLLLSHAQERKKIGTYESSKRSRFLKELPLDLGGCLKTEVEDPKKQVLKKLSSLRESLS